MDLLHKRIHILKDDFGNQRPVDTVIIVYQTVAKAGNHAPRYIGVCLFEIGG